MRCLWLVGCQQQQQRQTAMKLTMLHMVRGAHTGSQSGSRCTNFISQMSIVLHCHYSSLSCLHPSFPSNLQFVAHIIIIIAPSYRSAMPGRLRYPEPLYSWGGLRYLFYRFTPNICCLLPASSSTFYVKNAFRAQIYRAQDSNPISDLDAKLHTACYLYICF
jgi:hypothetical protein